MTPIPVTVLIAARNEAVNLPMCLASLARFARRMVLDSNSNDGSAAIAAEYGAEVVQFHYAGGYPKKRQWALDTLAIDTPWVLLVDADESLPEPLVDEIAAVTQGTSSCDAYLITKGFHFLGRRFRFGGFSHSAVLLFKTGKARFERLVDDSPNALDMEVHERLLVAGTIGRLKTPLVHRDFKGLEAYIERHNKYSTWDARVRQQMLNGDGHAGESIRASILGDVQERRRFLKQIAIRTPGEPWLWFAYHYLLRLGFLEGRAGLIASQLRGQYISQVRAKLYELRFQERTRSNPVVGSL